MESTETQIITPNINRPVFTIFVALQFTCVEVQIILQSVEKNCWAVLNTTELNIHLYVQHCTLNQLKCATNHLDRDVD